MPLLQISTQVGQVLEPPAWNKGVPIVVNRVRPGWKWPTRGGALIQPGGVGAREAARVEREAALGSARGDAR